MKLITPSILICLLKHFQNTKILDFAYYTIYNCSPTGPSPTPQKKHDKSFKHATFSKKQNEHTRWLNKSLKVSKLKENIFNQVSSNEPIMSMFYWSFSKLNRSNDLEGSKSTKTSMPCRLFMQEYFFAS
jgi:hypothetical protein